MSKGGGPKVYLVDFGGDFGLEGGGIQAASGKGRTGGPPVNLVDFRDDLYLEWGGSQVVSGGVAGGVPPYIWRTFGLIWASIGGQDDPNPVRNPPNLRGAPAPPPPPRRHWVP